VGRVVGYIDIDDTSVQPSNIWFPLRSVIFLRRFVSQKKVQVEKRFGSLEGKQPEAMSMEAWLERRTNSKLLEERAGWEKREMTEGRHIFYFKNVVGVEGGEIIGTWDAPDDFENFEETEIKKGMMVGEEVRRSECGKRSDPQEDYMA